MGEPEESAEDEARATAIHQPPTANPERTQVRPIDVDRVRNEAEPADTPPVVREEG
jgi:hypothetical protein